MKDPHFIPIENRLDRSHLGDEKKLSRIVEAYLKLQGKFQPFDAAPQNYFWGPEHYHLHSSALFTQATREQQMQILERCSKNLVAESYFVEKSAFAYCAKMMLLAETTEIAQVYSMIANEEAIHLEWITPYIDVKDRVCPEGEFFGFLSFLIEECDANLLPYLVQVILEGWGLHHYKSLAKGCQHHNLKTIFLNIARDEALHHHTGEVVFDAQRASPQQHLFIEDCLKKYTEMVRFGPQHLISVVDEALGGISKSDKRQFLIDINARETAQQKLALLKKLMLQPGIERTVQKLDDEGYFTALI